MDSKTPARMLALILEGSPLGITSIPELRRAFSRFYLGFQTGPDPDFAAVLADGLPGFWVRVPESREDRTLFFLHGGGFTIGSTHDHKDLCAGLARAARARLFSLDYRLAPEHPFPAAPEDALDAYRWLLDQGIPAKSLAVAGISAGGTLALATLVQARDQGLSLPAAAVLMSPAPDLLFPGRSVERNQGRDWVTRARLDNLRTAYLGGADPADPLASPIHAKLSGLPPLLIQAGTGELLLDDIRRLAGKAEGEGVDVRFETYPDLFHCWQIFSSQLAGGREAVAAAGAFLDRLLEKG